MTDPYLIIGGGLCAAKAVESLRDAGYAGDLVVVTQEAHPPYERPALSKGFLLGDEGLDAVIPHDAAWYADQRVDLRMGTRVIAIDASGKTVRLEQVGGTAEAVDQGYERLLVATGSSVRRLPHLDDLDEGAPVAYLRTLEDSERLKQAFASESPQGRIVVVGGGWIGLEVTAAARQAGREVTLIESAEQPLLAVLGERIGASFAELHREHGVDVRLSTTLVGVERAGDAGVVVRTHPGEPVEAALVVVGIGASPNVELGRAAGLAMDDGADGTGGISVDESLRTSDPAIWAAGDVAAELHPEFGRRIRVEHWETAAEQGTAAGHAMAGQQVRYDRQPYFFTDQYDLGMEYVGNVGPEGFDDLVVRGDLAGDRSYLAFWLADGQVIAAMQCNDWDSSEALRDVVGRRPRPDRLRDPDVALADLVKE